MTQHKNADDEEWLETHVRKEIEAALDKKMAKFFWAVLVMIMGGVSSIAVGSVAWGKIVNRLTVVERHSQSDVDHMSMEKKIKLFVPRIELENTMRLQREQLSEVKEAVLRIESKLNNL